MKGTLFLYSVLGVFAALRPLPPDPPANPGTAIVSSPPVRAQVRRKPVRKIRVVKNRDSSGTDNSNSSYAALGIRAVPPGSTVHRTGVVEVPNSSYVALGVPLCWHDSWVERVRCDLQHFKLICTR